MMMKPLNIILSLVHDGSISSDGRPTWLVTNPDGNMMAVSSIINLGVEIESVNIIYLKKHRLKYSFCEGLIGNLENYIPRHNIKLIELNYNMITETQSIIEGLKYLDNIPFFFKNYDTSFSMGSYNTSENFHCYCTNYTKNIRFKCGGHFFIDKTNFNVEKIPTYVEVSCINFISWQTPTDWAKYKSKFLTLFIDLDGVTFKKTSAYMPPYAGQTLPLNKNMNYLKQLSKTHNIEIIFTSSRPESYRSVTEQQLSDCKIKYKTLLMGLNHGKRIIINDFSENGPYRTCDALNIPCDKDDLEIYLKGFE